MTSPSNEKASVRAPHSPAMEPARTVRPEGEQQVEAQHRWAAAPAAATRSPATGSFHALFDRVQTTRRSACR